nr:thiamine pyrophosphate-binding protein [Desulfobacterales bacterium]
MSQIDGSQLVVEALKKEGVKNVFTLSGVPSFGVYDGLASAGIRIIDVRHEQAAVLMAQGYARATGQPGVAWVVPGPGVLNAITGIANCYFGSAPVVVLAGKNPIPDFELSAFHDMDHLQIVRPLTRWCATVYETHRIAEYVSIAFREACSGQPSPTFVDFPQDVLETVVDEETVVRPERYRTRTRPFGDPDKVSEAINMLAMGERPIVIAGSGVLWSGAHHELLKFVEYTRIPCLTTPLARGTIPDNHPLNCFASRSLAMKKADVILFVGARLNFILGFGRPPRFNPSASTIQVDIEPREIGRNRPIDVGIVGDAKAVLGQLLDEAKTHKYFPRDLAWSDELNEEGKKKSERLMKWATSDRVPINPIRLCYEISRFLDRDAILTIDGGEILDFARSVIPSYVPGARMNPGVTGLLGIGIPYAIAAKIAHPNRQVLCLCGDGSFGFNGLEMDTAVRHKIPIVLVVSNNATWGLCSSWQKGVYGRDRTFGTMLSYTRYDQMIEAMGGYGELVERPEQIRPALERAFASGKPACLNVITDQETSEYSMSAQLRDISPKNAPSV